MPAYRVGTFVEDDLFEIWRNIATQSEAAADRVERTIIATFAALAATPGQGHWRKDLSETLRFWAVWEYLIVYRAEPLPIVIVAVLHGRRNPDSLVQMHYHRRRIEEHE